MNVDGGIQNKDVRVVLFFQGQIINTTITFLSFNLIKNTAEWKKSVRWNLVKTKINILMLRPTEERATCLIICTIVMDKPWPHLLSISNFHCSDTNSVLYANTAANVPIAIFK